MKLLSTKPSSGARGPVLLLPPAVAAAARQGWRLSQRRETGRRASEFIRDTLSVTVLSGRWMGEVAWGRMWCTAHVGDGATAQPPG